MKGNEEWHHNIVKMKLNCDIHFITHSIQASDQPTNQCSAQPSNKSAILWVDGRMFEHWRGFGEEEDEDVYELEIVVVCAQGLKSIIHTRLGRANASWIEFHFNCQARESVVDGINSWWLVASDEGRWTRIASRNSYQSTVYYINVLNIQFSLVKSWRAF